MVPAAAMKLSPVDRIFTRLGAQDNIVGGASTFLVELQVSSYISKLFIIIRNLTPVFYRRTTYDTDISLVTCGL
jgi:hypothetical protein